MIIHSWYMRQRYWIQMVLIPIVVWFYLGAMIGETILKVASYVESIVLHLIKESFVVIVSVSLFWFFGIGIAFDFIFRRKK